MVDISMQFDISSRENSWWLEK